MKVYAFIFLFLTVGLVCRSQERLGMTNSNYSSTNSIFLNPSSSVDSRTYMQFNIVGANLFLMTNIGYLPNFSYLQAAQGISNPQINTSHVFRKYLYANSSIEGPSFVMSKEDYGVGFFIRARSVGLMGNLPYQLANFIISNNPSPLPSANFNLKNVRFSNMTWLEYGVNFGKMIKRRRDNLFTLGASLRYISGVNIIYGNATHLVGNYNDTSFNAQTLDGNLRYNKAGFNTGKGFGLDVGFTYKKMKSVVDGYYANSKKSNCTYVDYKYKIGVSLRDLGFVQFGKNTTKSNVSGSGYFYTSLRDQSYTNAFQANFNPTTTHNPIIACLPTSLSGQFDYNVNDNFYVNATVVKNIVPNRFTGVQGANLISIAPRLEFRQFEMAMPLTFQRFLYPQLGFAFRVRTFVLGFDNVFPLFIKKNTYGVNIYFTLGFSIFKNPACKVRYKRVDNCAKDFKGRNLDSNGPKKKIFKRPVSNRGKTKKSHHRRHKRGKGGGSDTSIW